MSAGSLVREYYAAIDDGDYDALEDVLAADFTQERGDRTFTSRAEFVAFMRDDRPRQDTRHEVERVYDGPGGDVAATGRLVATGGDDAGDVLFHFLDVFTTSDGKLSTLRTFVG